MIWIQSKQSGDHKTTWIYLLLERKMMPSGNLSLPRSSLIFPPSKCSIVPLLLWCSNMCRDLQTRFLGYSGRELQYLGSQDMLFHLDVEACKII